MRRMTMTQLPSPIDHKHAGMLYVICIKPNILYCTYLLNPNPNPNLNPNPAYKEGKKHDQNKFIGGEGGTGGGLDAAVTKPR
jgi:hypothetical protein